MTASLSPAIIDTHCHLDVEAFDQDRLMVLERARVNGVQGMVVPGVDASGWPGLIALCGTQPDLYPALGLHPIYSRRHKDADLELLEALIERERPTAIGEIGLDFFIENPDEERQQYLFECQLAIAGAAGLPVVLHVRKAHDQVLHTLKRMSIRQGVAHAFSGSYEQAIAVGFDCVGD